MGKKWEAFLITVTNCDANLRDLQQTKAGSSQKNREAGKRSVISRQTSCRRLTSREDKKGTAEVGEGRKGNRPQPCRTPGVLPYPARLWAFPQLGLSGPSTDLLYTRKAFLIASGSAVRRAAQAKLRTSAEARPDRRRIELRLTFAAASDVLYHASCRLPGTPDSPGLRG